MGVEVEHLHIEFPGDGLGAVDEVGGVVEEFRDHALVSWQRVLVAEESECHLPAFTLGLNHGAEHLAAGYTCAEAVAKVKKEAVEPLVLKRVVGLSHEVVAGVHVG